MTRNRFDIAYKKWLRQIEVDEDEAVWGKIQDELDFADTWDGIAAKLDEVMPQKVRRPPMRYLKVLAAIAAIVLILFLPVRNFIEQRYKKTIISELSSQVDEMEKLTSAEPTTLNAAKEDVESAQRVVSEAPPANEPDEKPLESLLIGEVDKKEKVLSVETTALKAAKQETEVSQRVVSEIPHTNKHDEKSLALFSSNQLISSIEGKESESANYRIEVPDLQRMDYLPFEDNILLASNESNPRIPIQTEFNAFFETSKSSGFSFKVVELGVVYGYKNTWLLNHETRNGLNPSKLGKTLLTFNQDFGVSSSFEVNNRHQFGLEFLWKSETGQKYQQYIDASYVERIINLDYLKLQAFYLWNNNRLPGQAIVGGYFASLTLAEEQQAKTVFSMNDRYSDLDYGLLVGYQLSIALKNKIIVKPSVRFSYNLVNIFEGDDIIPSYFKKTKNLSVSFNMSFSYSFFK